MNCARCTSNSSISVIRHMWAKLTNIECSLYVFYWKTLNLIGRAWSVTLLRTVHLPILQICIRQALIIHSHTHTERKHLDFIALWHQILTYLCNYWMLVPQMPALCSIWLLSNATSWMISYRPHVSNDFNEHLIRSLSASVGACITCTKCVCNEVAIWRISMRGI